MAVDRNLKMVGGAFVLGIALSTFNLTQAAEAVKNPFEGKAEVIPEGKSLFNQYCSHCHGPNAEQGERPRDLRRLKLRYGDEAPQVFHETVNQGRMDKGMPVWKGVLTDDVQWRIYTFLQSVQTQ